MSNTQINVHVGSTIIIIMSESWIVTGMCVSYQYRGDKLVEEDDLDASHSQCDRGVNFRHV